MPLDLQVLGHGVYTPKEAARLIGARAQDVLRWTRGSGPNTPLWHAYYHDLDDSTELSFADLVEVRVVRAFRRAGVSLQAIRYAIIFAQKEFDIARPLSSLGFQTDGKEILMEALEQDGEYVSLSKTKAGQKVFAEIVKQSLVDLEYDGNRPVRWRPRQTKGILLDPTRQFGAPILDEFGISSALLKSEFDQFGNAKYLSKIYEIPLSLVREAISFEVGLDERGG
ncbi:hypothetical protein ACXYMP_00495 [Aliiroseovarius sp. CAU 1755]